MPGKSPLNERVAVLTGAGGGIGTALLPRLLDAGFRVLLVGRDAERLAALERQFGAKALAFPCDLVMPDQITQLAARIAGEIGHVDILINNAGVIHPGPAGTQPERDILHQIGTNFQGAILLTRALLGLWRGPGAIVFVNSMAGLLPLKDSAVYSATKFGLRGFALSLRMELQPQGITVSTVFPGAVDTSMLRREMTSGGSDMNFLGNPLPPAQVADTIMRAIRQGRPEYYIPRADGVLVQLGMMFPGLLLRLSPLLESIGQRRKQQMLRKGGWTA